MSKRISIESKWRNEYQLSRYPQISKRISIEYDTHEWAVKSENYVRTWHRLQQIRWGNTQYDPTMCNRSKENPQSNESWCTPMHWEHFDIEMLVSDRHCPDRERNRPSHWDTKVLWRGTCVGVSVYKNSVLLYLWCVLSRTLEENNDTDTYQSTIVSNVATKSASRLLLIAEPKRRMDKTALFNFKSRRIRSIRSFSSYRSSMGEKKAR